MKSHHLIPAFVAILLLSSPWAKAVTADELARYLGVNTWSTKVALPPGSFTAEIYTIKNGAPDKRLLEGMSAWNKKPEKGLTVLLGSVDNKYKAVIAYGGGVTVGVVSDIRTFDSTSGPCLPEQISEGDYLLFGSLRDKNLPAENIASYKEGFLLRIKKTE